MITFDYFVNMWRTPIKDQVLLHAMYNLLGKNYEPILKGIQPNVISARAASLFSEFGIIKHSTGDFYTCSELTRELMSFLITGNLLKKEAFESEVLRLYREVYLPVWPEGLQ